MNFRQKFKFFTIFVISSRILKIYDFQAFLLQLCFECPEKENKEDLLNKFVGSMILKSISKNIKKIR